MEALATQCTTDVRTPNCEFEIFLSKAHQRKLCHLSRDKGPCGADHAQRSFHVFDRPHETVKAIRFTRKGRGSCSSSSLPQCRHKGGMWKQCRGGLYMGHGFGRVVSEPSAWWYVSSNKINWTSWLTWWIADNIIQSLAVSCPTNYFDFPRPRADLLKVLSRSLQLYCKLQPLLPRPVRIHTYKYGVPKLVRTIISVYWRLSVLSVIKSGRLTSDAGSIIGLWHTFKVCN